MLKRCVISGKVQFTKTKAKRIAKESNGAYRQYRCPDCGKSHLTTKSRNHVNKH